MRARLLFTAAVLISIAGPAWAQGRELVTALSRDVAAVGESIPLIYRFVNTPEPSNMPQMIPVDGLEITFQSAQTQRSMNFSFDNSGLRDQSETAIEYMYVVRPQRPGDFTIPGFEVRVGNRTMKTKPAKLRVVGAGSPVPRAAPAQPAVPPGQQGVPIDPFQLLNQMLGGGGVQLPGMPGFPLPMPQPGGPPPSGRRDGEDFFAEMNIGTRTAYVGQVVPVDLRFFFPAGMIRDGWEPPDPQFSGDGFSVAPLGRPRQTTSERNGMDYRVYTFRTAIIPAKTGDLEIPPAKIGLQLISGAMFGRSAEEVEVVTSPGKLRVEPLPEDGRPISFSGAIGQDFELSADVDPQSAEPGEPLTFSLTVRGRGNFDAMVAPELNSTAGWRTFPPKDDFRPDEDSRFGGSKTFAFKMIARRDQTATPGAEFSYFDPDKKKYITLNVDPLPVVAKGRESADAAAGEADDASAAAPSADAAAGDAVAVEGIGGLARTLGESGAKTFVPLVRKPWFVWGVISIGLALFTALPILFWLRRRAAKNALANELRWALKQAHSALGKAADRTEFYNAAAHLVQARLAVGEGQKGRFVDTTDALRRQVQDPVLRREIESVLGRRDEMKYGGRSGGALDAAEKSRVMAVLEKFTNNHD